MKNITGRLENDELVFQFLRGEKIKVFYNTLPSYTYLYICISDKKYRKVLNKLFLILINPANNDIKVEHPSNIR